MKRQEATVQGRRGFAQAFGATPEGVWLAPGRVNLFGEHTDYQQGLCLPMAIGRHTGVAARRRTDGRVRAYSTVVNAGAEGDLATLAPGPKGEWFNYVAGVIAGLEPPGGVDLFIFGDMSLGAGLSSSAALELAVGLAVNDLYGLGRTAEALARIGQRAENEFAGVSSGIMDQFASALGQEGKALLLDTRGPTAVPIPFSPEDMGVMLAVVDTRAPHQVVAGGYQARFEEAQAAAAALGVKSLRDAQPGDVQRLTDERLRRRARHIVSENRRVLQVVEAASRGEWVGVGQAFYASHQSLAGDYEVSHPALDAVVEVAAATEGVFGARLTGAGFGGSAIVLLEALAEEDLLARLRAAYAARGWEPFGYEAAHASAGARRVDEGAEA